MKIRVVEDSIINVQADALLTAVRPNTMPLGRVDSAIGRCAKSQFHRQAHKILLSKPEQKVVIARRRQYHEGKFRHVIFVVDDVVEPLEDVVSRGLTAAVSSGFEVVSLPAIRFREEQELEKRADMVRSIVTAIVHHEVNCKSSLSEVNLVIYKDSKLANEFKQGIAHAFSSL